MFDPGEGPVHIFQQVVVRRKVKELAHVLLPAQAAGDVIVMSSSLRGPLVLQCESKLMSLEPQDDDGVIVLGITEICQFALRPHLTGGSPPRLGAFLQEAQVDLVQLQGMKNVHLAVTQFALASSHQSVLSHPLEALRAIGADGVNKVSSERRQGKPQNQTAVNQSSDPPVE